MTPDRQPVIPAALEAETSAESSVGASWEERARKAEATLQEIAGDFICATSAKAGQDEIDRQLALFDAIQPGDSVVLDTGERYEIQERQWVRAPWAKGGGDLTWIQAPSCMPLLRAAIAGGKARVEAKQC